MKRGLSILCLLVFLVGFIPMRGESSIVQSEDSDSLETPLYYYTEAIKSLNIYQDAERAKRFLSSSLTLDSLYAPANHKLAEILIMGGDAESAVDYARKAYNSDTLNKFYLKYYAHSLVMAMRLEPALKYYYKLLEVDRHNRENYRVTALLEEQVGSVDRAVAILDSAEVLFGVDERLGAIKRTLLIKQKRFDRALEEALKAVDAVPYNPLHHLSLGEIYVALGEDSLARVSFNRAVELGPQDLMTLLSVSEYYFRNRDMSSYFAVSKLIFEHPDMPLQDKLNMYNHYTSDVRFYRDYYPQISGLVVILMNNYPKNREVVDLYANNFIVWGDVERALEVYKGHLDDEPVVKDYYVSVIQIENYLERTDSVDLYLGRAIELFPDDYELHLHKGLISTSERDDLKSGIESFERALELVQSDSLRSVVWGIIGDSYQSASIGDRKTTEEAFRLRDNGRGTWRRLLKRCYAAYDNALKYDSNNISVLNNYAYFLSLEERDLERALEYSSRVVALTNNNPTYLDTHAWVLFKLGHLDEAKRILQQAVSLDGQKSPELQVHYGDVLAALGERFMAETYWKRARDNGYDAAEIERRLNELKIQPQSR